MDNKKLKNNYNFIIILIRCINGLLVEEE